MLCQSAKVVFIEPRVLKGNDHWIIPKQCKVFCYTILLPIPEYTAYYTNKGIVLISKAVPLQARRGPEGSRKLRFPDFVTTAQDGGKVVSLTHQPPLLQEILLILISVRG